MKNQRILKLTRKDCEELIPSDFTFSRCSYTHQMQALVWAAQKDNIALFMEMGTGKGQPLDSDILTPFGWKKMKELKIGDKVIGSNGKPAKILQIHPLGIKNIYKVTFSDNAKTYCTIDHLWAVTTTNKLFRNEQFLVYSTEELIKQKLIYNNTNYKFYIPTIKPVKFHQSNNKYPIHPYVLGILLGDGTLSKHV